jgi:hypothetical protein
MFLLTFVTLIVAFVGIYAQVLALQTARFYASQQGIAQEMQIWHAAAVSMAASIIDTNSAAYAPFTTTGCSLTFNPPAGLGLCPEPLDPINGPITGNSPNGTVAYGNLPAQNPKLNQIYNAITAATECVNLPTTTATCQSSYNINSYQFFSVLYQTNNQDYVITFVPKATISASNPLPGFLSLPVINGANNTGANPVTIGITASDLLQQFQNSGMANYTYGTVNAAGTQITAGSLNGTSQTYVFPVTFSAGLKAILSNSIAVISSPDGF